MKLFHTCLFACLAVAALFFAAPAQATTEEAAKNYVVGLVDSVLDELKSDKSDEAKLQTLNNLFLKNVDTDWIGKFVLGKYWRQASDEQQKEYLKYYGGFLTNTYTKRFTEYTNEKVEVVGVKSIGEGEYETAVKLISADTAPVEMHYKLRNMGGSFKVFDIIVEGVSLITTQRSEFGAVVERKGMDHLISLLKKRATS